MSVEPTREPEEAREAPATSEAHKAVLRKAKWGAVFLALRTVFVQLTVLVGNVYLTRVLGPAEYGVFAIAQFAVSFFTVFGDGGLGGALIQKKEEPTADELASVWCFQTLLGIAVVTLVSASASLLVRFWPQMPVGAPWVLRVISIEFLLTSMRVVPTILMERRLQFGRLSVLEVLLKIGFYATAVPLAHFKFGVYALAGGLLVQGLVGLVVAFAFERWRPRFVLDRAALRPILKFGVAYQAKHVMGFINGAVTPLIGGRLFGAPRLGLINFGNQTASFPLQINELVSRVTFPLYSRLRDDEAAFAGALQRTVRVSALVMFFFTALMIGVGPGLVKVVYGDKWLASLPYLYVFSAALTFGFLVPIISPALDAIGRPDLLARLSILWTTLTWLGVFVCARVWGEMGFVACYCAIQVGSNLLVVWLVRKLIPHARLLRPLIVPAIAAAIVTVAARRFALPRIEGAWAAAWLIGAVVAMAIAFALVTLLLQPQTIRELKRFKQREA